MQQFVVPQFIDVEDKILGPVTIRQFIILLVGAIIIFIVYKLADFALFITTLALVGGFSLILAFVKVNGQTFHFFLLNVFQTLKKPSRRVWHKFYDKAELKEFIAEGKSDSEVPVVEIVKTRAPATRIRDLSLVINTGGYWKGS